MSLRTEELLRLVADTARRNEPLPPALRASQLPGAEGIADRLEAGDDLATALGAALPPPLLAMLGENSPELALTAALITEELTQARERRQLLFNHLAYPLVSLVLFIAATTWMVLDGTVPLAAGWLVLLVPAVLLAVVLPLAPLAWPATGRLFPWFLSWALHHRRAGRYRRAAIAARWRLPAERLQALFGDDLAELAPVLVAPDGEERCRDLATYHGAAAERRLRLLLRIVTAGLYLGVGAIALACLAGFLGAYLAAGFAY